MTSRNKKAGSTASYGARYGVKIKKQMKRVKGMKQQKWTCPRCNMKKVKRLSAGIYECRKCGFKFAGGAYSPFTAPGENAQKLFAKT
jgi:large subunit ribosomal protein L37Ae